jgi:hypothetical protein
MIQRSLKGKLLVFGVFFIGIAAGVLLTNIYDARVQGDTQEVNRQVRAEQDVRNFHDYLGLSEEQRRQVREIMEESGRQFRDLAEETRPQYQAIRQESREKIRGLLDDAQRAKYDEFFNNQRQRRQQRQRQN